MVASRREGPEKETVPGCVPWRPLASPAVPWRPLGTLGYGKLTG
ncbi:hypothetical protein AB0395_36655 [Streptosporangium sp. NPDC051023]